MSKIKTGFLSLIIILLISACGTTDIEQATHSADFVPDKVEMHVSLDDYKLLGEMNVSIKYSRYFGLFKIMESINEEPVNRRSKKTMELYGHDKIKIRNNLERALYKVHKEYPDYDIIVPVYKVKEKKKMFLGRKIKEILKVKIYKTKS